MTYTRAGTSPLTPIRSLSDGGNASPLLKMGSFIKGIDFLRHISTRNILPPIVLVEINLRWLKHPFTLHNGVFLIIVIKISNKRLVPNKQVWGNIFENKINRDSDTY